MLTSETTKVCFKCGETKKLSMFYKHPRMADGHVNKCKECNKKDVQENYRVNIDHFKAYDVLRRDTDVRKATRTKRGNTVKEQYKTNPLFREKVIKYKDDWITKNIEKRVAHCAVSNAVRDGKLIKPSFCTKCGKSGCTIYGHHWSYLPEHQLDVLWVCSSCHGKEHRKV